MNGTRRVTPAQKKKKKKGGSVSKSKKQQEDAKLKARQNRAMAALGFSYNPQATLGEWVDEKTYSNGNWFYESIRRVAMNILFTVQPLHTIFPYTGYAEKEKTVAPSKATMRVLGLDDWEVKQLHNVFRQIDADDSGNLSIKEFYDYFAFSFVTPLAVRYFNTFDEDKSGELDFCEFAVAAWNFCGNCDKVGMINFAFDVYDMDDSGFVDAKEATQLLVEAFGDRKKMNENTLRLIGQLEKMEEMDVQMPKGAFVAFVRKHDSIFFPIFTLQREMRKHICGLEFWNRIRKGILKRSDITGRKAANLDLRHCRKAIRMSQMTRDGDGDGDGPNSMMIDGKPKKQNEGISPKSKSPKIKRMDSDRSDAMSVMSDATAMTRASTFSTAMKRGSTRGGGSKKINGSRRKGKSKSQKQRKKKGNLSVADQLKKQRVKYSDSKNNKKKTTKKAKPGHSGWHAAKSPDSSDASSVASFASKARSKRQNAWMQ